MHEQTGGEPLLAPAPVGASARADRLRPPVGLVAAVAQLSLQALGGAGGGLPASQGVRLLVLTSRSFVRLSYE